VLVCSSSLSSWKRGLTPFCCETPLNKAALESFPHTARERSTCQGPNCARCQLIPPLTVCVCILSAHHIPYTLVVEHQYCITTFETLFHTGSREQKEKVSALCGEDHTAHTMSRDLVSRLPPPSAARLSLVATAPLSVGHPAPVFSARAQPGSRCSLQGLPNLHIWTLKNHRIT
jgi:hypothetical protein